MSFPKAVEEVSKKVSIRLGPTGANADQLMEVKYTGLDADEPLGVHSVRADLTPALGENALETCTRLLVGSYR